MNACPRCRNYLGTLLGRLGYFVWVRCRACGTDYRISVDSVDTDTLDSLDAETDDDNAESLR